MSGGATHIERGEIAFTSSLQAIPLPIAYGRCKTSIRLIEKVTPEEIGCDLWAHAHDYWYGMTVAYNVSGSTRVYICTQSGTSDAVLDFPGGTGSGIVDGTCVWDYLNDEGTDCKTYYQYIIAAIAEGEIVGSVRTFYNKRSYTHTATDKGNGAVGWGMFLQHGNDALDQVGPSGYGYAGYNYQHTAILYSLHWTFQSGTQRELPALALEFDGVVFGDDFSLHGYDVANPADIIVDLVNHTRRGCGMPMSMIDPRLDRSVFDPLESSSYRTYCDASGLRISLFLDRQERCVDIIRRILLATNSDGFWSQGKIKVAPLGDSTIVSTLYRGPLGGFTDYVPAAASVRDFGPSDFLDKGAPVRISRRSPADCFNSFPVEYIDVSVGHCVMTMEDPDSGGVAQFGLRRAQMTSLGVGFHNAAPATLISRIMAQRSCRNRNTYTFRVGWPDVLLEPTDIITITETVAGLVSVKARISSIQDDGDSITITAEQYDPRVATAEMYTPPTNTGYQPFERTTVERQWTMGDGTRNMDQLADGGTYFKVTGVSASHQVQEASIAALAVTEPKINGGAVTEAKLGALAVTEGKIGALAVTEGKIGALAVVAGKIGTNAVTTVKIAVDAISPTNVLSMSRNTALTSNGLYASRIKQRI